MVFVEDITDDEALDLKKKANTFFGRGDLAKADELYTEALRLAEDRSLRATLHLNRCQARRKRSHFHGALEDAVSALQLDYRLLKARFRKGLCELSLLQLDAAAQTLQTCRGEGIDDEVDTAFEELAARQREQRGEYAHDLLASSDPGEATPCANFTGPIAVTLLGDRGRGLIATRNVKAGELLFACKAFTVAKKETLLKATVERLSTCGKRLHGEFWALSDGKSVPDVQSLPMAPDEPIGGTRDVDAERVKAVLDTNAHACGCMDVARGEPNDEGRAGLWLLGSLVNHSCRPTATRVFLADMLFCRASRDLREGEEVTDAYVSLLQPWYARASQLSSYGFELADARAVVEEYCMPRTVIEPLLRRLATHPGSGEEAAKHYLALTTEVESCCQRAVSKVTAGSAAAPPHVVAAARSLGTPEELHQLFCSTFAAAFVGLAMASANLGWWAPARAAYHKCCSLAEQASPGSAYHASWSWELLVCAYREKAATGPYVRYARRVFARHFGAGVFESTARRLQPKLTLPEGEGALPAAAAPALAAPAAPAALAAASPLAYRVSMEGSTVHVVVELGPLGPGDVDLDVSARCVRVRAPGKPDLEVALPAAVRPDEAARFAKKTRELRLALPVA